MIKLKLIRKNPNDMFQQFTHGELFIMDGGGTWLDFCYTLEDKVRDINKDGDLDDINEGKVYGCTAIPFGKYKGFLRFSPNKQRIVPELKDVKHFKNIQIHSGNSIEDSLGCILVGYKTDHKGSIWQSKNAEFDLVKMIENNGNEFEIEII